MRAFSQLLDDLVYTRSRNTKLKLIGDYLRETPDPDRGYGLAALTGTLDIPAVEECGQGLKPPFTELFDWAEGRTGQPAVRDVPVFRPFMLAHPLDETRVSLGDYAAEWKWDGIRVQLVHAGGQTRLYSRTGDDISGSFPDVAEAFARHGVLDGELLVKGAFQGGG